MIFEELWQNNPMYHVKGLKDFLPMFQNEVMMFQPGKGSITIMQAIFY